MSILRVGSGTTLTFSKELSREERANKKQRVNQGTGGSHAIFRKRQNDMAAAKKRRDGGME